jgi:hypothetical protein
LKLIASASIDAITLLLFHMLRLMISVFFRDGERAKDSIRLGRENLDGVSLFFFFCPLKTAH